MRHPCLHIAGLIVAGRPANRQAMRTEIPLLKRSCQAGMTGLGFGLAAVVIHFDYENRLPTTLTV
jgi:hypothetical protein